MVVSTAAESGAETGSSDNNDPLAQAMVDTSVGYFFEGGKSIGDDNPSMFRETIQNLFQNRPEDGRMLFAAGLLRVGFEIKIDPVKVEAPSESPAEALDTKLFLENWRLVAPTVIDMGIQATATDSASYDEEIVKAVLPIG